jgi:ribosomal protein L11 methyltransferase
MGCQGVSITDKNDVLDALESNLFWDYVDEKLLAESSDVVKVRSFFLEEEYGSRRGTLAERLDAIRENLPNCGSLEVTSALIDDADWANNWKQYYKPITVKNLRITPEWLKSPDDDAYTAVYLDPGMAFGTGEHETTKMCLSLMQESPMLGKKVYDIGCGSGILGIAAAKLGASVVMTDIDPTSVLTAQKNAEKNGVSDKVKILCADLLKGQGKEGIEEKNGGIETNFLS